MLGPTRRFLKRLVWPRTLFGRSLLIAVVPIVILQIVITYMFYNRHWDTVTRYLAEGVAGEVALLADQLRAAPDAAARSRLLDQMRRHTELVISLQPGATLEQAIEAARISDERLGHIDSKIVEGFEEKLRQPFAIDLRPEQADRIAAYVQLDQGVLRVLAPRRRVTSTTTWLLFVWMTGTSLTLILISLLFLRRQLTPIRGLALAAESFGKGRDVGDFKPQGAHEIRQAAHAFNLMRHRILRHISQRTEMLAAVSHDLRTPLTRMKLELELLGSDDDPNLKSLRQDVEEMARLVETYLDFARGEGQEAVQPTELRPILESMRQRAERSGIALDIAMDEPITLPLRQTAFRRCLGNLVDNACRYGRWIGISAARREEMVEIMVEDDGPGIPEAYREKVLDPFVRLDETPPGENGGTGLGLTIARDVVLAHGGDLRLDRSRKGGLKALLRLPA